MSDLIKEAIADAKAVREMAVKQAKAALEEAFAPQVDAIISRRLQTEMDDDEEEYDDSDVDFEEGISPESGVELGTDDDHEEAQEDSGLTEDADTSGIGTSDNKEPSATSSEESTDDPGGTQDVDPDHDTAKESELTEEVDDDVDLEEIVRELEEEADSIYEDDDEFESEDDDDEIEIDTDDDGDADVDVDVDVEPEEEEESEDDVEEELELEVEDDEEEFDAEPEGDEEEELDLEAFMGEAEDEDFEDEDEMEVESLRTENKQLKKKMREALKVVKFQKDRLNEINILNAKLLFTNKVFSKYNLDDASKITVIENFDRARSVREIKLIFATLMENMKAEKRSKTSPRAQRLVEGASKAMGSNKVKKDNQIVDEQNDPRNRVHKLMGWKK